MGKKIIMILLSAVFIFTMSEQVRAAEISTNGGSVSVPVRYTVDNTAFTITIPTVIWAGTSETEFEIAAGNINLRPDEEIQVFIKEGCDEQSKIKLLRQGDTQNDSVLETSVTVNETSLSDNNYRVGRFVDKSGTTNLDGKVTLSPLNIDKDTKAGDYLATVVFEVKLGSYEK